MIPGDGPEAVRRYLHGLRTSEWDGIEDYYAPDAIYDASVPGWRCQYEGSSRIAAGLREEWTAGHGWRIVELRVAETTDGAVVELELRGRTAVEGAGGGSDPARRLQVGRRLAAVFRLEDGRIAEHRCYSCGDWDEDTLRRIEAWAPKVRRPAPL